MYITSRNKIDEFGEEFYSIQKSILKSLLEINLIPIPIFDREQFKFISSNYQKPQFILLSGGENKGLNTDRDDLERLLLEHSISEQIPVLGICRGMQQMLYFFDQSPQELQKHISTSHMVSGEFNSVVNSFHQFGYFSVPENFQILARCSDESIEAVFEHRYKWLGLMWHPERMSDRNWLNILIKDYF